MINTMPSDYVMQLAENLEVYESSCVSQDGIEQDCIRCDMSGCDCIIVNGHDVDFRALHLMTHHGYTMDGQYRV